MKFYTRLRKACGIYFRIPALSADSEAMSRERLEEKLSQFLETVRQIPCDGQNLSCSIGAVQVGTIRDIDELYRTADHYLYLAKNRGRDQFFIGEAGAVPAEGIACL